MINFNGTAGEKRTCDSIPSLAMATFGRVTDVNHMSGTPHHLWKAAQEMGLSMEAVDLPRSNDFPVARFFWQLKQALRGRNPRGYMWSPEFLEKAWQSNRDVFDRSEVIFNFQVYPPSAVARAERGEIKISFYIDITLRELFANYHSLPRLGAATTREVFALETRGYQAAHRIIVFPGPIACVLREHYGVDPTKIFEVSPGANIDDALADTVLEPTPFPHDGDFLVGFVGMDYHRKGLLLLSDAIAALRRRGRPIRLLVIGPNPPELQNRDGIELLGRIDKRTDMKRFIDTLHRCDLGALPSTAEGVAISILEFLRIGVPVLATKVGGIAHAVPKGAGILLDPGVTVGQLEIELDRLLTSAETMHALRAAAWKNRHVVSWRRAIAEMAAHFSSDAKMRQ